MDQEKLCYSCREVKNLTEYYKAKGRKHGVQGVCKECCKKYERDRRKSDPTFRARLNQKSKEYRQKNPEYFKVKTAERKAAKLRATPSWLTKEHLQEIKDIYLTCPEGYEVDHIVPLQGRNVSGLHVPWNLQHLTKGENRRKGNAFNPDPSA